MDSGNPKLVSPGMRLKCNFVLIIFEGHDILQQQHNGNVIHLTGFAALRWLKLDSAAEHLEQSCPLSVNATASLFNSLPQLICVVCVAFEEDEILYILCQGLIYSIQWKNNEIIHLLTPSPSQIS